MLDSFQGIATDPAFNAASSASVNPWSDYTSALVGMYRWEGQTYSADQRQAGVRAHYDDVVSFIGDRARWNDRVDEWVNSISGAHVTDHSLDERREISSILDWVPGVNALKSAFQTSLGMDLITGEQVNPYGQLAMTALNVAPVGLLGGTGGRGAVRAAGRTITTARGEGLGLGFQNLEYRRFRLQGFSPDQARYLMEPYPASDMGHHFIARQYSWARGGLVPDSIVESPLNIMGRGMSRGRFYERHFLGDPYFYGTAFPRNIGGTWSGAAVGLTKPMRPFNLWHAAPNWLRNTGVGAAVAGGAWGTYECFDD